MAAGSFASLLYFGAWYRDLIRPLTLILSSQRFHILAGRHILFSPPTGVIVVAPRARESARIVPTVPTVFRRRGQSVQTAKAPITLGRRCGGRPVVVGQALPLALCHSGHRPFLRTPVRECVGNRVQG